MIKKLRYWCAYIPIIGWFWMMYIGIRGKDTNICIVDVKNGNITYHFIITLLLQIISFVSLILYIALK